MKHILRLVNYCKNTITSTQPTFLRWRFGLYQRPSSEEVCSIPLPVLATIVMRRDKKSVVRVAQRVAPLVPVHKLPSFFSISCHIVSQPWQELEEELNKLLLMKVSDRDGNVNIMRWSNSIFAVMASFHHWAHCTYWWRHRCQDDSNGSLTRELKETTRASPYHVAQNRSLWRLMSTDGTTNSYWCMPEKNYQFLSLPSSGQRLRGAGSPTNTIWPGLRPISMPSAILIHPAVWPQQTWAENWVGSSAPFLGRGAVSPFNTMWPGPRPTRMPSFILIRPTVWPQNTNITDRETYRTGQDRLTTVW